MSKGKMNADLGHALKPFDGKDDFTDWQRMMKNVLIQQDLDDALSGEKPASMTNTTWTKVLKKAKSSIEIHLTRSVRSHITEKMIAQEACEKLENVYMGKTVSNKLFLKDELFGLRLEERGDIEDHVEETYKDDDMAIILLRSLPSSFKHFQTTLMFGKESLKLEDVIQALQSYAKLDDITKSSQGLYAKGKEKGLEKTKEEKIGNIGRSKSKKKKEKKEGCFECGSTDHWKRNCKIWKEKKAKREGSSSSASAVTEHESDGEFLSVTLGSKAFTNWILDTGCTFHMCAVREWFDTYKEVSSGEVLMGDDSSCPVKGIDEAGYGYKSKKGRLRVAKGSLVARAHKPERVARITQARPVGGVSSCKLDFCEYCVLGKQRKVSFTSSSADNRSKEQLSYIYSNVWGPVPTKSNGRARYFVTFMDDLSRKVWVYFMKQKSEVFAKFMEWKTKTENQTGRKIKYLRSDNRGFEKGVKGFKLWDINNRKKVVNRDVVFDETTMPLNKVESSREKKDNVEIKATKILLINSDEKEAQVEQIEQDAESDGFEEEEEHQHRSPVRNQVEQEIGQIEGTLIYQTSQRVQIPTNNPPTFQRCIALDKPNWNKKEPDRFGFNQNEVNYALNISQGDPTTY
ncbi:unnamed protein product [Prunus armeniaca]